MMTPAVSIFLPATTTTTTRDVPPTTFVTDEDHKQLQQQELPVLMSDDESTATKPQHQHKSMKQVRFDDVVDVSTITPPSSPPPTGSSDSDNSHDENSTVEFWYTSEELTCIRRSLVNDLSHYRRFFEECGGNTNKNAMIDETQYCVRGVEHHLCKDVVFEKRRKVRSAIEGTLTTQLQLKAAGIADPALFLQTIYSISASWASEDARVRGSADAADAIKIYLELATEAADDNQVTTTPKHSLDDDSHQEEEQTRQTLSKNISYKRRRVS